MKSVRDKKGLVQAAAKKRDRNGLSVIQLGLAQAAGADRLSELIANEGAYSASAQIVRAKRDKNPANVPQMR